jgi:hypothetical protein
VRPRGFRAFHPRIPAGARPETSRLISQASFSHANHTIRFLNVPIFSDASEAGDHVGDVIAAEAFCFLNRHIPDFILEAVEDRNVWQCR